MRRGFTLIELLVVIAIIAILAAILFPVFARARVTAITTKCCSHGRELGIAMQTYMDDNGGRFPSGATADTLARFTHITWHYRWPAYDESHQHDWGVGGQNQFAYIQLAPYVRNAAIWQCPQPESWYAMKYAYGYRNSWFFVTKSYWWDYRDTGFQDANGVGRTITQVLAKDLGDWHRYTTPSRKIWAWCVSMGDAFQVSAWVGGPVITPSYPHGEGSIYVYVDGHARHRETGCGWAPVGYTSHSVDKPHRRRP